MGSVLAEIITTGNEVLGGRIIDTNGVYLSRRLAQAGITPAYRTTVGDDEGHLCEVLNAALGRAQVVVMTGGLGPTEDDLTREVCAKVLGKKLVHNEEAEKHVSAVLKKYGVTFEEPELRQAFFPESARLIPNTHGTAYGFYAEKGGRVLAALSGVPSELAQMTDEYLLPYLAESFREVSPDVVRLLHIFGLSESQLQKLTRPVLKDYPEIAWGITASQLVITLGLAAPHGREDVVTSAQRRISEKLKLRLFATGGRTLHETVAFLLMERRLTLAVAESCTGGLVSHLLTEVPGVSASLLESVVTYSNESKVSRLGVSKESLETHGAVSGQVAEEMARGVREESGADFGLSTTGIAGPAGGTPQKPVGLVYIAVAAGQGAWRRKFTFSGSRSDIKLRAANTALNMLRLAILRGLPK